MAKCFSQDMDMDGNSHSSDLNEFAETIVRLYTTTKRAMRKKLESITMPGLWVGSIAASRSACMGRQRRGVGNE